MKTTRLIGLKWKRREACSLQVLIGRGLDHKLCVKFENAFGRLCSILRLQPLKTGIYGDEVTPVPIPNTEVKLISVENTWLATAWEDRAMPVQMKAPRLVNQAGSFLCTKIFVAFRQSFYQSDGYIAIFAYKCLTKTFISNIVK